MSLSTTQKKKIALIQGGLGAEREISHRSSQAVAQVLDQLNKAYFILESDPELPLKLLQTQPSIAFLALHGKYAEDGIAQSLCEYLKIPYTGSGVLASSLCMNKCFFKQIVTEWGIPTPNYQSLNLKNQNLCDLLPPAQMPFPFVVKPSREGSSLGISICQSSKDFLPAVKKALQYDTQILLESYVKGVELACSFLDGQLLTPVEIVPKKGFYDYSNKYTSGRTEYILPPRVPQSVFKQCYSIVSRLVHLLQIRSYCRVDFIIKDNTPFITELNTLPGLTSTSLLPKSAAYDGISFKEVIQIILKGACLDYEV